MTRTQFKEFLRVWRCLLLKSSESEMVMIEMDYS